MRQRQRRRIWCAGVVLTIDRATIAWRSSCHVRQHSLRCTAAYRCCLAGRAQLSHNVESLRRALHFRPSISPPMHGGAAAVCAKVAYDMRLRIVVVWWNARTFDHRSRLPCTVVPPPCAPRLRTICVYVSLSCGGTRADVGQCRLVEARCAVSTIDLTARARWRRRRVRQGFLRCTSARCCRVVGRAQISDNVDSS
jgi:hypothetical protein